MYPSSVGEVALRPVMSARDIRLVNDSKVRGCSVYEHTLYDQDFGDKIYE